MRTAHRVRIAAILALGAFALHQLRFLLAFGGSSSAELAQQGHRYMPDLLPPIAVLALAAALATVVRGTEAASPARTSLSRGVRFFTGALLAIFAGQEMLESLVAAGHPSGPGAVLGHGGLVVVPLALAIGALSALLVRALEGVERAIAVVHARRARSPRAPSVRGRALPARRPRLSCASLAFGFARRPPPPAPA
jgi:hypothetical protein